MSVSSQVSPEAFLKDLDIPGSFDHAVQRLLGNGNGGGFVTWLTVFASAAAQAVKQGTLDVDTALLKDAFAKVVLRLDPNDEDNDNAQHDKIALEAAQRILCSL